MMLYKHTIDYYQKINGTDVPVSEDAVITLDNNARYTNTFYVKCDGIVDNNSFKLSYYGDDEFIINRNRCELDVVIKPNLTPYDKEFYITCTHVEDAEVNKTLTIVHPADHYEIDITNLDNNSLDYVNKDDGSDIKSVTGYNSLDEEEKENYSKRYTLSLKKEITTPFNENLSDNANYNYYEEKTLNLTIRGGSGKYRIKTLCKEIVEEDGEETTTYKQKFDDGFVYTMFPDSFVIRSYGKPFIENGYYELTLCHEDMKECNVSLKIVYEQTRNIRRNTNNRRKNNIQNEQPRKIIHSLSVAKLRKEYLEKLEVENQTRTIEYDILFDDNIGENIDIIGKTTIDNMKFKVLEDGVESNLMVVGSATGRWCDVSFDDTNRKLKIKILDKPICERKCIVKISIIEYPNIYITFMVTNKPS